MPLQAESVSCTPLPLMNPGEPACSSVSSQAAGSLPQIWLAPICASAVLGPISSAALGMKNTAVGAGMGTSGLVGQFGAVDAMSAGGVGALPMAVQIGLMHFILPAVVTLGFDFIFRKIGWVKPGMMKLAPAGESVSAPESASNTEAAFDTDITSAAEVISETEAISSSEAKEGAGAEAKEGAGAEAEEDKKNS